MDFLRFLEGLRTPCATAFLSLITYCGSEVFFIAVAVAVFWCVSKRDGYYILLVGFLGSTLNQFLKLWFRIPRPWVLDPGFTVVESARPGATGYSFPSGHTQNIVGTTACVLLMTLEKSADQAAPGDGDGFSLSATVRRRAVLCIRAAAVALMLLVPFSRMYLGCHTPLDVGVSFALALFLALAIRPLVLRNEKNPRFLWIVLFLSVGIASLYWAFVSFYSFPSDIDPANLASGVKNSYKLLGCLAGLIAAKTLDDRYLHFQVKAVWWAQIPKTLLGLFFVLGIMAGLKAPLQAILPLYAATAARYSLAVFFAGAIWPLTFPWFAGLGQKD